MEQKKRWKRILAVLAVMLVAIVAAGCGGPEETGALDEELNYEIAMVSDSATIEDDGVNEAIWQGIEQFVGERPASYKYYLAAGDTTEAYLKTIHEAVQGGAKVILTEGAACGIAVHQAQEQYEDVSFVMLDGWPMPEDTYRAEIGENTASVLFDEKQAGYLAGYAAVEEGYKELGFIGGRPQAYVKRFGYGFVQGAKQAAADAGITGIHVKYAYSDTYDMDARVTSVAESWYEDGTEVIFACAGAAGKSVMEAAERKGGKVIGVNADQAGLSKSVVISAVKNFSTAVHDLLQYYYDDEFPGGKAVRMNVENGGIALSMQSSRMENFGIAKYDAACKKLARDESLQILSEITGAEQLTDARVQVEELAFRADRVKKDGTAASDKAKDAGNAAGKEKEDV